MNRRTRKRSYMKPCARVLFLSLALCCLCWLGNSQPYENAPFDPATSALPPGYYGYDPEAFVKQFQEATTRDQQARQKDEFETTAQYQKRLSEMDAQNPLTSKTYAFAVAPTRILYDADSQTFTLTFKPEQAPHNANYVSVLLKEGAKDAGSYLAENAFGATFTVTKSVFSSYYLWLVKGEAELACTVTAKAEAPEAKAMKPSIFALVVARPFHPYVSVNSTFSDATFSNPHENEYRTATIYARYLGVRLYERNTGRILGSCP